MKPLSVWIFGEFKGQRDSLYDAKKLAESFEPEYLFVWSQQGDNWWIGSSKHVRATIDNRPAPLSREEEIAKKAENNIFTKGSYMETFGVDINLQDWIESYSMTFSGNEDVEVFYQHWTQVYQPHEVPYLLHEILELEKNRS